MINWGQQYRLLGEIGLVFCQSSSYKKYFPIPLKGPNLKKSMQSLETSGLIPKVGFVALAVVENTDFKVIWLRKRRYYSHLKGSEISKNIEMSRDGSDLMVNGYINEGITAP